MALTPAPREMTLRYPATCDDHTVPHRMRPGDNVYGHRVRGSWRFVCPDAYWGNAFADAERETEAQIFLENGP